MLVSELSLGDLIDQGLEGVLVRLYLEHDGQVAQLLFLVPIQTFAAFFVRVPQLAMIVLALSLKLAFEDILRARELLLQTPTQPIHDFAVVIHILMAEFLTRDLRVLQISVRLDEEGHHALWLPSEHLHPRLQDQSQAPQPRYFPMDD